MGQNRDIWSNLLMFVLLLLMAAARSHALAAGLKEVQSFGDNPSSTRMFIYVPDKLAATPPILVAIHYCTGSAMAFFTGTTYRMQADRHGFIVIYPETTASDRCFDVHSPETLKHDGGGESNAIASMVRYALREYKADAQRVYVTGTSSGAMMTNVMLGAYPDMFRAGSAFAGVPFGCFAGPDRWNGDCAMGKVTKSGQEWGELVRAAYPGYMGPRPRMQLWHGDQDETLSFHNFGEEIKEWTNVLGVSEMPSSTEQNAPQAPWTRTRYADSAGVVQVEALVGPGMPHNLTVLSDEAVRFFGLDADRDPAPAAGSGAAGSTGTAADSGGNGAAGSTGTAADSGGNGAAGSTGAAAGSGGNIGTTATSGGSSAGSTGAAASSGGNVGTTAASGGSGAGSTGAAPGAAAGSGGSAGTSSDTGAAAASGGSAAGTSAAANSSNTAGAPAANSSNNTAAGRTAAPSSTSQPASTTAASGETPQPTAAKSGCTAAPGAATGKSSAAWLLVVALGMSRAARRRRNTRRR